MELKSQGIVDLKAKKRGAVAVLKAMAHAVSVQTAFVKNAWGLEIQV